MKNKRIYIYFSKVIKGKLSTKIKIKINSNSLHKLKHHIVNPIVQLKEPFRKIQKIT